MNRLILYLLGGILCISMLVMVTVWVEYQVLGKDTYDSWKDTITWTMIGKPFEDLFKTIAEGLGSPFAGMTTYFESILPEAMRPYAWVVAVLLTGGISLISILVILKVANRI